MPVIVIETEDRRIVIAAEKRVIVIEAEDRRVVV